MLATNYKHRLSGASSAGNSSSNKQKGKFHCTHCNGNNHTVDRCYHLHGFPSSNKFHKKTEKPDDKKQSFIGNTQSEAPSFTPEQYLKILALLHHGNSQPQANVAGDIRSDLLVLPLPVPDDLIPNITPNTHEVPTVLPLLVLGNFVPNAT
ncbi:hypothetical protein LWI29_010702 [Acer saccharum]|uniref:Uncharacterized protein n=1 Tax=Acer saccharum TaxID=4024 RepID=A0AA39SRW2_ACESA|nr:hypothetical protein LWI29_010702 [Acer saccharum]